MSIREFTEEEMKQLEIERGLGEGLGLFIEDADTIIDQCVMIPEQSYEKGAEEITRLVTELNSIIQKFEQEVRDKGLWQVGFGDNGLNIYTMFIKTYKRAANTLKCKASIMKTLIHD